MGRIFKLIIFLISAFAIINPLIAFAARPLSTSDAGTVDEKHLEIESGFEYVKQRDEEYNLSFVLTYGIAQNLDLAAEVPYQFIDLSESVNVDGIGDIKVTGKVHLLDELEKIPALALTLSIKTKTGDKDRGLGSGELDYILNGVASKGIGKCITHLNIGYTFVGEPEGENLDDIFSYSFAIEYPMNENLNVVGEVTGETTFDGDFNDNPCSGLVGLNYAINEMISFDFGVGFQISEASPDYRIVTGLTRGF